MAEPDFDEIFSHQDFCGGGSELDIYNFLKSCISSTGFSEVDKGVIVICTHDYITRTDLHISARSWRPVLLTCIRAAVSTVGPQEVDSWLAADDFLLHCCSHWWPRPNADAAYEVFIQSAFIGALTKKTVIGTYFVLRDNSLMHISDTSFGSAAAVEEFSNGRSHDSLAISESSDSSAGRPVPIPGPPGGRVPVPPPGCKPAKSSPRGKPATNSSPRQQTTVLHQL
jgi:hypothetical protein